MIHVFGRVDPPVQRLVATLATRGHRVNDSGIAPDGASTLVLGPGPEIDQLALGVLLGAWRRAPEARVLVLSLVGAHPDARAPRLQRLWALEERARGFALPVLTLRLAPLLGDSSPLWLKLRSRPRLPDRGRQVLNPVLEADVIETLVRALEGRARWEGWYEVAGNDALTLAELAELARAAGPARERGEWEPPLEEMREHRLCEPSPWIEHFGVRPLAVASLVAERVS